MEILNQKLFNKKLYKYRFKTLNQNFKVLQMNMSKINQTN